MRASNEWLLLIFFIATSGSAQTRGVVKGTVVDDTGKPVVNAQVHIAEKQKFVGHRLIQMYETGSNGQFLIEKVPWGTYVVLAGKEDAGYPDTKGAFYSNLAVPTVTLAPEFPSADVRVQLGTKAGVLRLIPVKDLTTGKVIESASITLRRSQNPDFFITTSVSAGQILVPAETDVTVEITADSYKPWPPRRIRNVADSG